LITVTVTEPHALEDIIGALDRQVAEGTWGYAAVYDLRVARLLTEAEGEQLRAHIRAIGEGRGPVVLRVAPQPGQFASGLDFARRVSGLFDLEVVLTSQQFEAWLERNVRARDPRG
jgi:hypothetical protein